MPSPLPRWNGRRQFALPTSAAAFPVIMAGRLPQRHFEACSVFISHYGPHGSLTRFARAFSGSTSAHLFPPDPLPVLRAGAMSPAGICTRIPKTPLQGVHNNNCERKIRPTAVGKKNWFFVGEATAGQRSAVIYTIIESCRAHGLDPYTYLREVLTRLPASTNWQVTHLTPAAWAKTKTVSRSAA